MVDRNDGAALRREGVRYATLAPSSHNTQCWKFAVEDRAITVLPDLSRRFEAAAAGHGAQGLVPTDMFHDPAAQGAERPGAVTRQPARQGGVA